MCLADAFTRLWDNTLSKAPGSSANKELISNGVLSPDKTYTEFGQPGVRLKHINEWQIHPQTLIMNHMQA